MEYTRWLGWMAVAALSMLGVPQARASVVQALDLATMTTTADHVLVGRVVAQESHYDEHGRIVTDVEMMVEQSEKGDAMPGATVLVRRHGGVVNGIGMRIEGEPSFEEGERTLLFAKKVGSAAVLRAVGLSQGVLRIAERDGDSWVASNAGGAALVRRAADGSLTKARIAMEQPRKLSDVLKEIRALLAKTKP